MPTNICMIGPDLDAMGGISSVARTWLGAQSLSRWNVQYFGTMRNTETQAEKAAVVVRRQARFAGRLAGGWRPELFHIHSSYFSSFYRKMAYFKEAALTGRPVILHLHAPDLPSFYESSIAHRTAIRHVFKRAARVVVLSEDMAKIVHGWMGRDVRLQVLYNPVSLTRFDNPDRSEHDRPTVLFMGEIGERKGAWDLLEAITRLTPRFPNACFRFGGNGEIERLRSEIDDRGLRDSVEILGWVSGEEKLRHFRESDLLCLPSYHEGLPMSILEAMASGLPVVSTKIAGIPEAVTQDETGLLVEPGNVDALTHALEQLIQSRSLREEMGRAARDRAERVFDAEVIGSQVHALWSEVLDEHGSRT